MPSYTRPLQALGALPLRNRDNTRPGEPCTATYTWDDYINYKQRVIISESNRHKSWEDHHLVHETAIQFGFVMTIFVVEDLWDDITDLAREVLLSTWEDELEMHGTELRLRGEINGHQGRTTEMEWLEEGLELIGNPRFNFDPEYLRQNFPYDTGDTVGDLKACMVRCLLREQCMKLNNHFKRRRGTSSSVGARGLRGLIPC